MIASLAYAIVLCTAAQVEVTVAPDQSFQQVYLDDPLVLEFLSPVDAEVRVEVGMRVMGQPPRSFTIGSLRLPAASPVWKTIGDRPRARGPHELSIRIFSGGEKQDIRSRYFRLARPWRSARVPLLLNASDTFSPDLYRALRGVPVSEVRVRSDAADWVERARWLASLGYGVVVRVPGDATDAEVAGLLEDAGPVAAAVSRWEISFSERTERMAAFAGVLRGLTPDATILVALDSRDAMRAILQTESPNRIDGFIVSAESDSAEGVERYRAEAAALGFEGLRFELESRPEALELSQLVTRLAYGLTAEIADPAALFAEESLQDGFCALSAFGEILARTRYLGPLEFDDATTGFVFLSREAPVHWVVPLWSAGEDTAVELAVGDARDVAVLDRFGNPIATTTVLDGRAQVVVGGSPVYLRGSGGTVVRRVVGDRIRVEAAGLLRDYADDLDDLDYLSSILSKLESDEGDLAHRFEFLRLVQMLEVLERRRHLGEMSFQRAVPLSAGLARIAMGLSVLQEELGGPILEPLAATLAKCEEYRSRFQEASAEEQRRHERGPWLVAEVGRLTGFARELEAAGRRNEARAVAAVAEWRARALDARTPLAGAEETP